MQTLLVKTSVPCPPHQLIKRRKDIISQAIDVLGRDGAHDLFHNHQGKKAVHRYPLIQYRSQGHRLVLFAMAEAVPALIKVITEAEIHNKAHLLTLATVEMNLGNAQIRPSRRDEYYRLMDWVAFNNETFNEKWKTSYSLIERVALMNQAITGHLRILGAELLPDADAQEIIGELYMLTHRKTQHLYGNRVMGFNVIFKTPYLLPNHFALGRGISLGTGTFQKLKNNPEQRKDKSAIGKRKKKTTLSINRKGITVF